MVRQADFFASEEDEDHFVDSKDTDKSSKDICSYWVDLFPSPTFEEAYESNIAIVATITVGTTFVIVAFIFWVYDFLVNKRNNKITAVAEKSNAVVNSLFPVEVRDRLMEAETEFDILESSSSPYGDGNLGGKSRPIAELYPDVTIIFCDIVGFTAWSSMREPHQVFELLESLYADFDRIARCVPH